MQNLESRRLQKVYFHILLLHSVAEIENEGPLVVFRILLQKSVAIHKDDTPEALQRRVMEQAEWKLLPRACEMVCRNIRKGRTV